MAVTGLLTAGGTLLAVLLVLVRRRASSPPAPLTEEEAASGSPPPPTEEDAAGGSPTPLTEGDTGGAPESEPDPPEPASAETERVRQWGETFETEFGRQIGDRILRRAESLLTDSERAVTTLQERYQRYAGFTEWSPEGDGTPAVVDDDPRDVVDEMVETIRTAVRDEIGQMDRRIDVEEMAPRIVLEDEGSYDLPRELGRLDLGRIGEDVLRRETVTYRAVPRLAEAAEAIPNDAPPGQLMTLLGRLRDERGAVRDRVEEEAAEFERLCADIERSVEGRRRDVERLPDPVGSRLLSALGVDGGGRSPETGPASIVDGTADSRIDEKTALLRGCRLGEAESLLGERVDEATTSLRRCRFDEAKSLLGDVLEDADDLYATVAQLSPVLAHARRGADAYRGVDLGAAPLLTERLLEELGEWVGEAYGRRYDVERDGHGGGGEIVLRYYDRGSDPEGSTADRLPSPDTIEAARTVLRILQEERRRGDGRVVTRTVDEALSERYNDDVAVVLEDFLSGHETFAQSAFPREGDGGDEIEVRLDGRENEPFVTAERELVDESVRRRH